MNGFKIGCLTMLLTGCAILPEFRREIILDPEYGVWYCIDGRVFWSEKDGDEKSPVFRLDDKDTQWECGKSPNVFPTVEAEKWST